MKYNITILLVVVVSLFYLSVIFLGPAYRYGDDLRYLSFTKTMAETGNAVPVQDTAAGAAFDGPPLFEYFLLTLYMMFHGSAHLWLLASKLFVFLIFLLSVLVLNKIIDRFGLNAKGKAVALAFFAFYPPIIFTSTSVMQDSLLMLFTLLCLNIIVSASRNISSAVKIGTFMGLMLITKVTAPLPVASILLAALVLHGRSRKTLGFCALSLVIALAIWSPWVARNLYLFGNPVYHHSAEETYTLYPGASLLEKSVYVFLSLWGIPPASSVSARMPVVPEGAAFAGEVLITLFLLPLLVVGVKDAFKAKFRLFAPLISLGLLFTLVYMSVVVSWVDPRHFIFALPFFSILIGNWAGSSKSGVPKIYIVSCMVLFLLGSVIIEGKISELRGLLLGQLESVLEEQPGKTVVTCKSDQDLAMVSNLFYWRTTKVSDTYNSCALSKVGVLSYCYDEESLFIFRDATSSSTC